MNQIGSISGSKLRLSQTSGEMKVATGLAILWILAIAIMALGVIATGSNPFEQVLGSRRIPPIWFEWLGLSNVSDTSHLFGTDKLGRDYLARIFLGGGVSLLICFSAVGIAAMIGTTLGAIAGYFGGRVDACLLFFLSVRLSVPAILIALVSAVLFGSSLIMIIVILGALLWDRFFVVVRSLVRTQSKLGYVDAAKEAGASTAWIIAREIGPNIRGPLLVIVTVEMAHVLLLEASLSFLGLGVQPPLPSWGLMLSEAKEDIFFNGWMIIIPGLFIFALVFSINIISELLRISITRSQGRRGQVGMTNTEITR